MTYASSMKIRMPSAINPKQDDMRNIKPIINPLCLNDDQRMEIKVIYHALKFHCKETPHAITKSNYEGKMQMLEVVFGTGFFTDK